MTTERMSMRQAAKALGVSQIRVRELIRKGTLTAEKVSEDGTDRWAIASASLETYRDQRVRTSSPRPASRAQLEKLLPALEEQLDRIRTLIAEVERGQSYLEGLRKAQGHIAGDVSEVRQQLSAAGGEETANGSTREGKRAGLKVTPAAAEAGTAAEEPKQDEATPKAAVEEKAASTAPAAGKKPAAKRSRAKPADGKSAKPEKAAGTKKSPAKAKSTKASGGAKKTKGTASKTNTAMAAALEDAGVAAASGAKKAAKRPATKKGRSSS